MYLIATLELSYSGVQTFFEIAPLVRSLMEKRGCKMLHAMLQDTGRLNTIVHIWELRDANQYFEAVTSLKTDPAFAEILAALSRSVVDERLVFAQETPYAPARGSAPSG